YRLGLPTEAPTLHALWSEGWSGRRGSNPRPTAWKAVTLPLSYSRLRPAGGAPWRCGGQARLPCTDDPSLPGFSTGPSTRSTRSGHSTRPSARPAMSEPGGSHRERPGESNGGEGRIRTFEALRRQIYSLLRLTA